MDRKRNRYKEMEQRMTWVLLANTFLFVLYLFAAGFGVTWLKAVTAIIAILVSVLCLVFLFFTQELMKPRSLWMSAAAAATLLCILISLLLGFPSPNPYKQVEEPVSTVQTTDTAPD